jgi:hypothetical protein
VFTARYALSPYIKQIRFVFKGLNSFVTFTVDSQVLNTSEILSLASEMNHTTKLTRLLYRVSVLCLEDNDDQWITELTESLHGSEQ